MYRVFCKGLNSSFVAGIYENWSIVLIPVVVVDKILLFERRVVGKIVMIHLCERKNQDSSLEIYVRHLKVHKYCLMTYLPVLYKIIQ